MPRLPYPRLAPDAYKALQSVGHYLRTGTALDHTLIELIDLRASQMNGCEFCIAMHTHELLQHHEPKSRIDAVETWRYSDAFTPREKAALAWTEELTNIQDGHASDEAFAAVSQFFKDKDLVDLTFAITTINAWNRLAIAFRAEWNPLIRPGGTHIESPAANTAVTS